MMVVVAVDVHRWSPQSATNNAVAYQQQDWHCYCHWQYQSMQALAS
jgi:hypothetical protein